MRNPIDRLYLPMVDYIMKSSDLIKWRQDKGYSQVDLAKALGVAPNTVYRWEKDMRDIPPFLHLALECMEKKKGGDSKPKGVKTKMETKTERKVKK